MDDRARDADERVEKDAEFDLSKAIAAWRRRLSQSSALGVDNVDELEAHLRDAAEDLQGRGLTAAEAFLVASRRVGEPAILAEEFSKSNAARLWLDRVLWLVLGAAFFGALQSMQSSVQLITAVPSMIPMLALIVWMLPISLALLFARSLLNGDGRAPRLLTWLLQSPTRLALCLFALALFNIGLRSFALSRITGWHDNGELSAAIAIGILPWALTIAVVWTLARRRHRLGVEAES